MTVNNIWQIGNSFRATTALPGIFKENFTITDLKYTDKRMVTFHSSTFPIYLSPSFT